MQNNLGAVQCMHSNRHVAPKVQRNLVRSRATAKQLSCTRTHTLLCGHCVLFCTRGGWLAATGAMSTPRARKKAKTSAERRLETLQGCHTNKFADIDFSKFQLRRAAAGDPMQVVPVKARSDALVQDWRDVLLRGTAAHPHVQGSHRQAGRFLAHHGAQQPVPGHHCQNRMTSLHAGSLRIAWARVAFQIAHWHPTLVALVLVCALCRPMLCIGYTACKVQNTAPTVLAM